MAGHESFFEYFGQHFVEWMRPPATWSEELAGQFDDDFKAYTADDSPEVGSGPMGYHY